MSLSTIRQYYDYTQPFYESFYYKNSKSYALHYGFWEKGTKTRDETLLNTNQFLASKAKIAKKDTVLDAGCGVGGSSIWLAKNVGAKVIGITISEKQVQKAKELAKENKVEKNTEFLLKNYLKTGFQKESFDVVWAIESVCHSEDKADFLKEAFRLLKKGGRLVVADGFLRRSPQNKKEGQLLTDFCEGLAVPNLVKIEGFKKSLEKTGFKNTVYWDKTNEVRPTSKKLYKMCRRSYPIAKITEKLKITQNILTKNNLAGLAQYEVVECGLACYGVFYAEKVKTIKKDAGMIS
ncbi:MAG: methyltransferase domain-containing protein [Candidatus Aenigmarchaeota archaeon]|nr:methyltransferase domain-containing protein [Candidatus Aenigmarchaeota archaeon]